MSKYDIRFKRLALLLLPTFLRRPVMAALTYAAVVPLCGLHAGFMSFREESARRLARSGQVCRLRAVLNDLFDPSLRRIAVSGTELRSAASFVFRRSENRASLVPLRGRAEALRIGRRGFGGAGSCDFSVDLPPELRGIDEVRLAAVVDACKLASKRFVISYH